MGGGAGRSLTPLRINEPPAHEPLARKTRKGQIQVLGSLRLTQFGDPVNESEHTITSSRLGPGLQGARASKGPEA